MYDAVWISSPCIWQFGWIRKLSFHFKIKISREQRFRSQSGIKHNKKVMSEKQTFLRSIHAKSIEKSAEIKQIS